jgi:hypothetical protein
MQGSSAIVFLVRPRCPALVLAPWGPPGGADLRQEVNIEFIGKDHHLLRTSVFVLKPNPCQAFDPVRGVIFGHQFGTFPHPADLRQPAPHGFRRALDAVCGLERRGEGRTPPPGAAPAVGPRSFCEDGAQRAREPRQEEGRRHSAGELPIGIEASAQAPSAIRPHNTVDAGARAKEERRNLRRRASRRTQQQEMERQQIALSRTAEASTPLDLLCWRDLQEGG